MSKSIIPDPEMGLMLYAKPETINFESLPFETKRLIINKFLNKSAELSAPFFEKLIAEFKGRLTESDAIALKTIVEAAIYELPRIVTELWENQTVEISHEELGNLGG